MAEGGSGFLPGVGDHAVGDGEESQQTGESVFHRKIETGFGLRFPQLEDAGKQPGDIAQGRKSNNQYSFDVPLRYRRVMVAREVRLLRAVGNSIRMNGG